MPSPTSESPKTSQPRSPASKSTSTKPLSDRPLLPLQIQGFPGDNVVSPAPEFRQKPPGSPPNPLYLPPVVLTLTNPDLPPLSEDDHNLLLRYIAHNEKLDSLAAELAAPPLPPPPPLPLHRPLPRPHPTPRQTRSHRGPPHRPPRFPRPRRTPPRRLLHAPPPHLPPRLRPQDQGPRTKD